MKSGLRKPGYFIETCNRDIWTNAYIWLQNRPYGNEVILRG